MAVVETVSTNGAYKVLSSSNATLATAISEVINELEDQKLSGNKVQFQFSIDSSDNYVVLAFVKNSPGTPY